MHSDIEEIKSRLNIVDFIGEYIRLEKAGANWRARCPFHNEKSPSFMINEEKQIFHCFGCGKGGDVFTFSMEMDGLEFKESIKILADKAGVELSYKGNKSGENNKNKTIEILELATKFYEKQLWEGPGKTKVLEYLKERGMQDDSMKRFRLGFAPAGWRNLSDFLIQRGYNLDDIVKAGLALKKDYGDGHYDRFRERILFPISDAMGKVVGFTGRILPGGDEKQAKYVNTPETEVYHKSLILYGIEKAKQAMKEKDSVLLVEGNMDVIACHQAGILNTIAVSGTALTPQQLDILKRYTHNIKMFFDMDEAGQQALTRSAKLAFQKEINVDVVSIENGKDAADVVQEDSQKLIEAVSNSVPAMEYFFESFFKKFNKDDVQSKKEIARGLLEIISSYANEIDRQHWVRKLAQKIDIEEKILYDMLNKVTTHNFSQKEDKKIEEIFVPKKRSDILKQKIIGLMLADSAIWKKIITEHESKFNLYFNSGEIRSILLRGGDYEFDFDKILITDEKINKFLRKLHFEAKFTFGDNQEIIEVSTMDNKSTFQYYWKELEKELKREKMKEVEMDIKKAEQSGDNEAVKILREEFLKLSQEIQSI